MSFATFCVCLELRSLPSAGVTRFPRYYEPLRHPRAPGLSLTGVRLVLSSLTEPRFGASRVARAFLVCVLPPVPRCSDWASSSLISPSCISLPRSCSRVGLHIDLFGACSAFTRVAARTLAPSPICDQLHRTLQPFRHLHDCSGCFRLERSPGGACTHWKAPPSHGARKYRSFIVGVVKSYRPIAALPDRCRFRQNAQE